MIGLSHVALLLPSVRRAANKLMELGFSVGRVELQNHLFLKICQVY